MGKVWLTAAITVLLGGCKCQEIGKQFTSGVGNMLAIGNDIHSELKVSAHIEISDKQGASVVTVKVAKLPEGDIQDFQRRVEAIVRRHLPKVSRVDVQAQLSLPGKDKSGEATPRP